MSATPQQLRSFVQSRASALGFHRVGVTTAESPAHYNRYIEWLDNGMHGSMSYMADDAHKRCRADLRELLPRVRSVIVVALAYAKSTRQNQAPDDGPRGFIARYARGQDYHHILHAKLRALAEALSEYAERPIASRVCVDSAPVLERELAERAGIGFIAKNTMLIAPRLGSYFVLGELLVDVDIAATTEQPVSRRCGDCRACLDACPTHAFPAAYSLDARRCISYLTIESSGDIPVELRRSIGDHVFGCDICQQVCPYNAAAPDRVEPAPELVARDLEHSAPNLIALLKRGANQRRRFVDGSALRRVNRAQLHRNLCVAMGNSEDKRAAAILEKTATDPNELVAEHARWARAQLSDCEPS